VNQTNRNETAVEISLQSLNNFLTVQDRSYQYDMIYTHIHIHIYTVRHKNCSLLTGTITLQNYEEVYSPRRQQYKHYNDNEHAKTDMYIEHYIKY